MSDVIKGALSGVTSINKLAEMYGVPRSIYKDRLSLPRVVHRTKPGPRHYLTLSRDERKTTKTKQRIKQKERKRMTEERAKKAAKKKLEKDEKEAKRNSRRAEKACSQANYYEGEAKHKSNSSKEVHTM